MRRMLPALARGVPALEDDHRGPLLLESGPDEAPETALSLLEPAIGLGHRELLLQVHTAEDGEPRLPCPRPGAGRGSRRKARPPGRGRGQPAPKLLEERRPAIRSRSARRSPRRAPRARGSCRSSGIGVLRGLDVAVVLLEVLPVRLRHLPARGGDRPRGGGGACGGPSSRGGSRASRRAPVRHGQHRSKKAISESMRSYRARLRRPNARSTRGSEYQEPKKMPILPRGGRRIQ